MAALATQGEVLLRIENVSVSYGPNKILENVATEIYDRVQPGGPPRPQIVAFVGLSGSGKTTLFRSIAGVERPTSGHIYVGADGVLVKPGMVGVVSQDYIVFEYFTVEQNLTLPARLAGMSKKEAHAKAHEFLERFGLSKLAHLFPDQLSGGQKQRLAILRQLISSVPTEESGSILLMDEPFSGLDPAAKDDVCHLILDVGNSHEKNTVIITSHSLRPALKVADTVWVLGREVDHLGVPIPGSRIIQTYDLVDRGLAWEEGIENRQAFQDLEYEIEATLKAQKLLKAA